VKNINKVFSIWKKWFYILKIYINIDEILKKINIHIFQF
jgi:hypothetical protein